MDNEEQPASPPAMPWWQSKIMLGAAIAIVTDIVHIFHLTKYVSTDQISSIADLGLQVVGIGSLIYIARGRLQQKYAAPVTLTKAKAAAINQATAPSPPPPETPT